MKNLQVASNWLLVMEEYLCQIALKKLLQNLSISLKGTETQPFSLLSLIHDLACNCLSFEVAFFVGLILFKYSVFTSSLYDISCL